MSLHLTTEGHAHWAHECFAIVFNTKDLADAIHHFEMELFTVDFVIDLHDRSHGVHSGSPIRFELVLDDAHLIRIRAVQT